MAKKPNLADLDMDFDFTDDKKEDAGSENDEAYIELTDDDLPKRIVGIYIKVDQHERQEIREWCVRHNKTMKDVLLEGYVSLTKKFGP